MTHLLTCPLCEAMCGLEVQTQGDEITQIRGDAQDPLSRGYVCPKSVALRDVDRDPDRLRTPLVRSRGELKPASWSAALDAAGELLCKVRQEHGSGAIALYQGNPTLASYATNLVAPELVRSIGEPRCFSTASMDHLPSLLAAYQLFGHQYLMPIPDIDHTNLLLVIGANPAVSNGSLMSAPGFKRRIKALKERGGQLIVVDPRRSETAELADQHHFIKPGADVFLLLAMVQVITSEGHVKLGHLSDIIDGVDTLRELAKDYTPERVAPRVGIEAAAIRQLVASFVSAKSAACYGRLGISTQEFGATCAWLLLVINALTGNLDRRGGFMFTTPAFDTVRVSSWLGMRGSFRAQGESAHGLPQFSGEEPVSTFATEIEAQRIRGLICSAGNPVLSTPNGASLARALPKLDALISIDLYVNETGRHAHVVLPPTFVFERDHYDIGRLAFAVRETARYAKPLRARTEEQRHDWEIYMALAQRLCRSPVQSLKNRAVTALGPRRILDTFLRLGPRSLSLKALENQPHGIDFGPLQPCLRKRLYTKDRRIQLVPELYTRDIARVEEALGRAESRELVMIGRRSLRSNNSWLHNAPTLMRGPERCVMVMHPSDAAVRGVSDGVFIKAESRTGAVTVPVCLSDEIMPGVVSLPHGYGHAVTGTWQRVAARSPGSSMNDLTDERLVDELSGTARLNGVPVSVTSMSGPQSTKDQ